MLAFYKSGKVGLCLGFLSTSGVMPRFPLVLFELLEVVAATPLSSSQRTRDIAGLRRILIATCVMVAWAGTLAAPTSAVTHGGRISRRAGCGEIVIIRPRSGPTHVSLR